MNSKGSVSILAYRQDRLDLLSQWIERAGLKAVGYLDGREFDEKHACDIILIDITTENGNDFTLTGHVGNHIAPAALVADCNDQSLYAKALGGPFMDIFEATTTPEVLTARLLPLLRLATMKQELRRREHLVRELGHWDKITPASENDESVPYDILIVGGANRLADILQQQVPNPIAISRADTTFEAESMLEGSMFEACIVDGSKFDDPTLILDFCNQVRLNARLFNLPVVIVADEDWFNNPAAPYDHGATCLVGTAMEKRELAPLTTLYIRRQRQRWLLRFAIERLHLPVFQDARSGIWSIDSFFHHLGIMLDDVKQRDKTMTLVYFRILGLTDITRDFGEDTVEQLIHQIANWIGGMVRVEDMVASHDDRTFILALPDTSEPEARIVMQRVANILTYTDFTLPDVYQPITVSVEMSMAEVTPDDEQATLTARASQLLE